jgi:uncharacterized protein YggE
MKKIVTLCLVFACGAFACQDEIIASGIAVKGYSIIKKKPEKAIAYFSIAGTGKTEEKAISDAEKNTKEFIDSLKSKNIEQLLIENIGIVDGRGNAPRHFTSYDVEQLFKSKIIKISIRNDERYTSLVDKWSKQLGLTNVTENDYNSTISNGYIYTSPFPKDVEDSLFQLSSKNAKENADKIAKIFKKEVGDLVLIYEACTNSGELSCSFPGNDYSSRNSYITEQFYSRNKDVIEFKSMTEVRYEFKK